MPDRGRQIRRLMPFSLRFRMAQQDQHKRRLGRPPADHIVECLSFQIVDDFAVHQLPVDGGLGLEIERVPGGDPAAAAIDDRSELTVNSVVMRVLGPMIDPSHSGESKDVRAAQALLDVLYRDRQSRPVPSLACRTEDIAGEFLAKSSN
jgi:hypothetical protein